MGLLSPQHHARQRQVLQTPSVKLKQVTQYAIKISKHQLALWFIWLNLSSTSCPQPFSHAPTHSGTWWHHRAKIRQVLISSTFQVAFQLKYASSRAFCPHGGKDQGILLRGFGRGGEENIKTNKPEGDCARYSGKESRECSVSEGGARGGCCCKLLPSSHLSCHRGSSLSSNHVLVDSILRMMYGWPTSISFRLGGIAFGESSFSPLCMSQAWADAVFPHLCFRSPWNGIIKSCTPESTLISHRVLGLPLPRKYVL